MASGPVLKWPGAKWRMAADIVASLPAHTTYLEPFFGSGAVFFNKEPSRLETINDYSGDVVNLFRVLRDRADDLSRALLLTPYAREEHLTAWDDERTGEAVEDARRFMVRVWMNHGQKTGYKCGWAHSTGKLKKTSGGITNRARLWASLPERVSAAAERLSGVQIESRPALDLLGRYAHPDCLIYADPPYPLDLRVGGLYRDEMTDDDHRALLEALNAHPGPVVLSGYACPLYDDHLGGWQREEIAATAEGGRARTEIVWRNGKAARARLC